MALKKAQEHALTNGDASSRLSKALYTTKAWRWWSRCCSTRRSPTRTRRRPPRTATAARAIRTARACCSSTRRRRWLKLSARQVRRYLAVLKVDRLAEQYAVDKKHGAPKDEFADPRREGERLAGDVTALYGIDFNDLADAIHRSRSRSSPPRRTRRPISSSTAAPMTTASECATKSAPMSTRKERWSTRRSTLRRTRRTNGHGRLLEVPVCDIGG